MSKPPSFGERVATFQEKRPVFVAIQCISIGLACYSIAAVVTAFNTLNNASADAHSLVLNWQMAPVLNVT